MHDICDYLQWPIGLVHKMAIEEMEERWQHKTEFQRKEALRVLDRADAPDRVKQTIKSNHARVR